MIELLYIIWGTGLFVLSVRCITGIHRAQISFSISYLAFLIWPALLLSKHGRKFLRGIIIA